MGDQLCLIVERKRSAGNISGYALPSIIPKPVIANIVHHPREKGICSVQGGTSYLSLKKRAVSVRNAMFIASSLLKVIIFAEGRGNEYGL